MVPICLAGVIRAVNNNKGDIQMQVQNMFCALDSEARRQQKPAPILKCKAAKKAPKFFLARLRWMFRKIHKKVEKKF